MLKNIFTTFLLVSLFSATASTVALADAPSISFSQNRIDTTLGDDFPITVTNTHPSKMAFRVEIVPETLPQALEKLPKGFSDCSAGLFAYPKLFELAPGKSQTVKFLGRKEGNCRVLFWAAKAKKQEIFVNFSGAKQTENSVTIGINYRTGLPASVKK